MDGEDMATGTGGFGEDDAGTGDRNEDLSVEIVGSFRCEVLGVD